MKDSKKAAILCQQPDEEKFTFSFFLDCPSPKIQKQFNMVRAKSEPMEQFLLRLRENLTKKLASKKQKKKPKLTTEEEGVNVTDDDQEIQISFLTEQEQEIHADLEVNALEFLSKPGIKVKVFTEVFDVEVNPPMILNARLSDTIMAGFLTYPSKLTFSFAAKEDSEYNWYVSEEKNCSNPLKATWVERHNGFFLSTSMDDINRLVKLEILPKLGTRAGNKFEVIGKNAVSPGPGKCPYEERHLFTPSKLGQDEFRVVTYNLLADLYADSDFSRTVLHPQCPPYALDIAYRKSLFVSELVGYNADIMCLQEVDKKIFVNDLFPVFQSQGFDAVFDLKGGQVSEGVACFWNSQKFQLLQSTRMVLGESVLTDALNSDILAALDANEQLKSSFVKRTTALQTVVLESKSDPKRGLIVGTTHLYFKPDADHIRLLQIAMIMRELERIKSCQEASGERQYSLLLCGDFNSTPPFGVLEFIRAKCIHEDHPDWSSAENEHVKNLNIVHPFNMDSACGTPKYTTYTIGFKDCLDYIFYQTDSIEVTNVVPFPLEEELAVHRGLPNVVFPSDHIACITDLKWKTTV